MPRQCQDKWKGPFDGERQPLQAEYTHAGPALHTELQRHRRTWCAIAQEQEWQAEPTFDPRFPEVRAPSKRQAVSGVSRPTCYLLCKDQTITPARWAYRQGFPPGQVSTWCERVQTSQHWVGIITLRTAGLTCHVSVVACLPIRLLLLSKAEANFLLESVILFHTALGSRPME